MSLHHGWGWQPTQTASCIYPVHIQCVSAHWYAVHRHTVAAFYSYTHTILLRFWGSGLHPRTRIGGGRAGCSGLVIRSVVCSVFCRCGPYIPYVISLMDVVALVPYPLRHCHWRHAVAIDIDVVAHCAITVIMNITNPFKDSSNLKTPNFNFVKQITVDLTWYIHKHLIMLYVNLLFTHKHIMVRLSGKLHLNYYVLCPTYACSCLIRFRIGFEFRILPLSKIRFRKVQSIFSHFVRKDTSHLSKTVSGLFGRYDYSALEDKTKIFFTKYFLLN